MAEKTLFSSDEIAGRVAELGAEISSYFRNRPLTAVTVMTGGICFAADLIRQINLPLWVDYISASSYRGTQSCGEVCIKAKPELDCTGRHILLIDDIIDSGFTLNCLVEYFKKLDAAEVKSCVLLDKASARQKNGLCAADWTGFKVPDAFVVGYGLDCDEEFRNSADIRLMTD